MSNATADPPGLTGELYRLPFLGTDLGERVAPLYEELVDEYGVGNVLVVKRFPVETDSIAETFGEAVGSVERPTVVGLSAHASGSLEDHPDPPRRLDHAERGLLLSSFIEDREWVDDYLERASEHESFSQDVGRFITEATWQGSEIETDDPALAELATVLDAYHERLDDVDVLDPARIFQYVVAGLENPAVRDQLRAPFDAVLALEFEEFTPIDREYLARLSEGRRLVCVAEAHSAIQRTWNEPGRITDHTPGLEVSELADRNPDSLPAAMASFLATGAIPDRPNEGAVQVIEAETFEDQVAAVGEEIERLHRTEGIAHDEMAVVLRDSNAPIPETLRRLRAAGVPVESATVGGLEHDPAARELYALTSWCVASMDDGPDDRSPIEVGWEARRARTLLEGRVPELTDTQLREVFERGRDDSLQSAIDVWILETDLKHRIADGTDALEARTQFDHVGQLRRLAGLIDRSELLESTWETLCDGIEREMQRATSDRIATELDVPEGGVLVDAVRVAKNADRRVVFMLDVVDREYPAEPLFNSLFPTPHLEQLPGYPAFTSPTADDVRETFAYAEEDVTRPLHAYYAALSRRLLAIGARAASDRLYFGTYREDATGTGQNLQPSRFLDEVEAAFGELERLEHDEVHTHGEAVRFALDRTDEALTDVRRAGLVSEPVDLDALETDLASIQLLLDADPPADLRPALEARIDFAEGAVRRE